jgi:hypothetical protein
MSNLDTQDCNICVAKFNKSTNKKVECPYCKFCVCQSCVKTMMIENGEICQNPDCKKPWSREFIKDNVTKGWFDTIYKEKRKEQFFDMEKSLLQTAIPYIKMEQYKKKTTKEIEEINKKINELENHKRELSFELQHNMNRLREGFEVEEVDHKKEEKSEYTVCSQRKFIRGCPAKDCRGFLSTQWKCELCDTWVCKDCLEIKTKKEDDDHKCNQDNVETAKMLLKDSKPCPKCGARIHRIEGCNAMFCVQCKTCFDYKTGKIQKQNSNPHFHQWANQSGVNQGNIEVNRTGVCGINLGEINQNINNNYKITKNKIRYSINYMNLITNFFVKLRHITEIIYPSLRTLNLEGEENKFMVLRIKYLSNEIDETEWKRQLFILNKKLEYETNIFNLYEVVVHIWITNLEKLGSVKTNEAFEECMKAIQDIVNYFNDNSKKVAKEFGYSSYPYIIYNRDGQPYISRQYRTIQTNGGYRQMRDPLTIDQENRLHIDFKKKKIEVEKRKKKETLSQFDESGSESESDEKKE